MDDYFGEQELLKPPVRRAAYSDRTAWLMSEMSRLAYFKFEGETKLADIVKSLASTSDEDEIEGALKSLLSSRHQTKEQAEKELITYLENGNFQLVKSFNVDGTQAFLAISDVYKMQVLAFRGTEGDMRDIKADLNAIQVEVEGVKIHGGFYNAFMGVKRDIEIELDNYKNKGYALYITGHSLGGALALLATKYLASDSVGACYTFGSPRVASSEFGDSIKTPIYRVINAADLVPRVPPAYIIHLLIAVLEVLHLPVISRFLISLLEKMVGYRHHGDMRYLTACKGDYSDLRLLQNPSIIDRFFRFLKRISLNWKAGATDHFVAGYCGKLAAYALGRNK